MLSLLFCELQPIEKTSTLQLGQVIFSSSLVKYGLYTGGKRIIFQENPQILDGKGCRIVVEFVSNFVGESDFFNVCFCSEGETKKRIERASNSLGKEKSEGIFSCLGDDFIYWCITGQYIEPDSNIFGKHLSVKFQDYYTHMIYAYHHGIGIENLGVVHFDDDVKGSEKKLGWKKSIQLDTYQKFESGQLVTMYEYPDESNDARLIARNRAINILFGDHQRRDYKLFSNNCEHLASWCKTGKRSSTQIDQLLQNIAVVALAGTCAIAQKKNYPQLIPYGRKIAGKYFKLPWQEL